MSAPRYKVFVSYSRENEDKKKRLLTHLSTLKAEGLIGVWDDRCIEAGDLWREELERAMSEAEVALFLVSAEFIESPFCQSVEVPEMLRRHQEDGVLIVPVIVDYCEWGNIEYLSRFQALPEDGQPVPAQRPQSKAWTQVVRGLRQRLKDKPPRKKTHGPAAEPAALKQPGRLSLPKLLEVMPGESGDLFGREEALGWLDAAYADPQVGVLALVGFGGIGKSALVRHWLETRFKPEDGAPRFLGVSFYSQGTRERAGSSDQFLVQALETFGETGVGQMSAWDRGERLAELIAAGPTVLVLDGLEPLQHGPGPLNLEGRLKDPGVHTLLAQLAKQPGKSLCLVSTRVGLTDDDLLTPSFVQKPVDVLSPAAARELLLSRGVRGGERDIDAAAEYLGRHPLALVLAAEYLHTFAGGEVGRLGEVSLLLSEETKEGRHAKSVMAAYEAALRRDGDPLDLELLGVIGLFDRPMQWDWLKALAAAPAIAGVTEHLATANDTELWESISRLRQWGMLADPATLETPELDAHPLIREYFGGELRRVNETGWRAAHSRMFDYLTAKTKELPNTLEEMEPLYQAVAHGCSASKYQEALDEVYWPRINRGEAAFNTRNLGAVGTELTVLSSFFLSYWQLPVPELKEYDKAYVLSEAGYALRTLGQLKESTHPMQAGLDSFIAQKEWKGAAIVARNLSETYLIIGDLVQALSYAHQSVRLADQSSDRFEQMAERTRLADTFHQAGYLSEAENAFSEAEEMQKEFNAQFPILYSFRGFNYCDLLLDQGKYQEVQARAEQTLTWVMSRGFLLAIAHDCLSMGRAYLLQAQQEAIDKFAEAADYLKRAVDGLRQSETLHELPRGLLARAELYRITGEFDRAQADLDEAMSIATRGSMGLREADCHLEYARLYVVRGERERARESWEKARGMVERMGYGRRDKDVREIDEQLKAAGV